MLIWVGVIILLVCFIYLISNSKWIGVAKGSAKLNYPPGPYNLPLLGFMPFLAINPQKTINYLGEKYGNIFSIFLGRYRVIVLNDYNVIREAYKEDVFTGRPNLKMLEIRNGGVRRGLVCSDGKEWTEQRRFTWKQLKGLGMGKQSMEILVREELDELIEGLRRDVGKPLNLQNRLSTAVLNALWRIICGERYRHDDSKLQYILKKTGADLAETQYTGPLLFLPWLTKLAPQVTRWNEFVNSVEAVHEFLQQIIQEHKCTYNRSNPRDFIDSYFGEIDRTSDPKSSFYKTYGEHSLLVVLLDLFMAGADTTSTTLYWAFLYMILHENVQKKVQEEIDQVIGQQIPQLDHRKIMPYTEATIMEILRKSSLVPMGLFHCTTANTKFLGYDIPKDSVVMANLYGVHNNRNYWGDPENFRPERFLDDTNRIKKVDALLPFSTGKRACPGETLARDELFLFLTGLLQLFNFQSDSTKHKPSEKARIGVILTPPPYTIIVTERL